VLSTEAQSYLARHKQLVQAVLHASGRIGLSDQVTAAHAAVLGRLWGCGVAGDMAWAAMFQSRPAQLVDGAHLYLQRAYLSGAISAVTCCLLLQVAHAAVALMDATVAAGGRPSDALEGLFIAACLRIAAANEGGYVPTPDEAAVLFGSSGAVFSKRQQAEGPFLSFMCLRLLQLTGGIGCAVCNSVGWSCRAFYPAVWVQQHQLRCQAMSSRLLPQGRRCCGWRRM
jgi:hypothetical protein